MALWIADFAYLEQTVWQIGYFVFAPSIAHGVDGQVRTKIAATELSSLLVNGAACKNAARETSSSFSGGERAFVRSHSFACHAIAAKEDEIARHAHAGDLRICAGVLMVVQHAQGQEEPGEQQQPRCSFL